ncbi:MAG: PQQ-dependent sugar dehydrogenase [Planctomycetota bacterium]
MHHWPDPRGALAGALLVALTPWAASQGLPTGFQYQPVVTSGLQDACAMAFAPDGRLFVCERVTGNVRIVQNGALLPQPWFTIGYTQPPINESGLLGIAIDPRFLTNRRVYLFYTEPNGLQNRIARVYDDNGVGRRFQVLSPPGVLPTHPFKIHNGGRMVFGADGKLYVGTGDAEDHSTPQTPASWAGKILRFTVPNLTAPADNPIPGNPLWARGIRNTFGIALHPRQRWIYTTENGYLIGDEINRIVPGGNYGWPQYEGPNAPAGYQQPLLTIPVQPVLTGLAFHDSPMYPPAYQGCLFVCQWLDGNVRRMTLSSNGNAVVANDAFADHGHAFDVQQAPDGNLWVLHGPSLNGANEIGRYLHGNAPAPALHLSVVSGPAVGGAVTLGVSAGNGHGLMTWVSLTRFTPPVPTLWGPVGAALEALLPIQIVAADNRCYMTLVVPQAPVLVGVALHAQSLDFNPAIMMGTVTNTATIVMR